MTLKQQCRNLVACVVMLSAIALIDFALVNPVATAQTAKPTELNASALRQDEATTLRAASVKAARVLQITHKPGTTYAGLSKAQAESAAAIAEAFPAKLFSKAVKVAWCESRLNATALNHNRNGSVDHGLFQINDGGTLQGLGISRSAALDPRKNARAAFKLYQDRGWQPWVCG